MYCAGLPVVASDVCGYAHYVRNAQMGSVIASPFDGGAYVMAINEALAVSGEHWHCKGERFAATSDVYSRPKVAVDIMEKLVAEKDASQ